MQDKFDIPSLPQEETKKMKLNKNILVFLGIGLAILIVLGFFTFYYIAPFGTQVVYQFTSNNKDKVSALNGAEQSESINNNATNTLTIPEQTIRQNIVTFNLGLLSKKIDGVWVNLKFKGDPKELKIGVKGELKGKYTYQPLYQQFLESIKPEKFSDLLFWQKDKKYKDFSEFAKIPPLEKTIATYNFDPTEIFSYISSNSTQGNFALNKMLRGTHEMLVKVDQAPLSIDIKKQDQNAYKGADVLSIEVYKENALIVKKEIPDDGIIEASSLRLQAQEAKIDIKDISPGIYRVLLLDKSKGGDVIITSIKINQKNVVFKSSVFIVDSKETKLFTTTSAISATTFHQAGLQTLKINGSKDFEIAKIMTTYPISLSENMNQKTATATSKLNEIDIPKNDLIIRGDGYFTFGKNSFFNPNPLNSIDLSDVTDTSGIDYIIARYQKVKKDGDWNVVQAYFDPKDINVDGDKLYFSLESPGLSQAEGEITIGSLEVTVNKPSWFGSALPNFTPIITTIKKEGILDKFINFLKNLWPFKLATSHQPSVISKSPKAPTNTPTPTPTLKEKLKITVQNGGGIVGIAAKYADLLKTEGFKNVESGNSSSDIKNASISYNKDQAKELDATISEIETILNKDYRTVNRITTTDKDKINIILGALPKPTSAPKATPTASPSASH